MKRLRAIVFSTAVAAAGGGADAAAAEIELLGSRTFTCDKGEVALDNDGRRKRYPPSKYEAVTISTPSGILRYTCRYVRGIVNCPIDTTSVRVKRASYGGRFEVACYGERLLRPSAPGLYGESSGDEAPATDAGADGAATSP